MKPLSQKEMNTILTKMTGYTHTPLNTIHREIGYFQKRGELPGTFKYEFDDLLNEMLNSFLSQPQGYDSSQIEELFFNVLDETMELYDSYFEYDPKVIDRLYEIAIGVFK